MLQPLLDALSTAWKPEHSANEAAVQLDGILSLPASICQILQTFCKVRGWKVIIRFFDSSPRYVDDLMSRLHRDRPEEIGATALDASRSTWQERYIGLLWLSHLVLTPFDLETVSTMKLLESSSSLVYTSTGIPAAARSLLTLGFSYLQVASKERDAARVLLVRLIWRPDVKKDDFPRSSIARMISHINDTNRAGDLEGNLYLLCGLIKAAEPTDIAALAGILQALWTELIDGDNDLHRLIFSSVQKRQAVVKIIRDAAVHACAALNSSPPELYDKLADLVEQGIGYLFEFVSDRDSLVRMAASKALSLVTRSLDPVMAVDVVRNVAETLSREIDVASILTTVPIKSIFEDVDAAKWHGLMLTLGHMLLRRSISSQELSHILPIIVSGLQFEQRSKPSSATVSVSVRDAACFGLWSIVRNYSTEELNKVSFHGDSLRREGTIQRLANALIASACLDPSGNIRRGSSAALQELVGRHPDSIPQGIFVVQVVDYSAVALRSRAIHEISHEVSKLDSSYRNTIFSALAGWRGTMARDAQSRLLAAMVIGQLIDLTSIKSSLDKTFALLKALGKSNSGSVAERRHGLLCEAAALLGRLSKHRRAAHTDSEDIVFENDDCQLTTVRSTSDAILASVGDLSARNSQSFEMILHAAACLTSAFVRFTFGVLAKLGIAARGEDSIFDSGAMIGVLQQCQSKSDDADVVQAAAAASRDLCMLLKGPTLTALIEAATPSRISLARTSPLKGRFTSLGAMFPAVSSSEQRKMLQVFHSTIDPSYPIETRVASLQGITEMFRQLGLNAHDVDISDFAPLSEVILAGLEDYTTDHRGDIGSKARTAAVCTVETLLQTEIFSLLAVHNQQNLLAAVAKLAGERLDQLRYKAWTCTHNSLQGSANATSK